MTWYANNVYAKRSEALEDALCRRFPKSVYRVIDFQLHSWWKPEIMHGVPPEGLLAVRPVAGGDPADHLHNWYDEPVVSWDDFITSCDCNEQLRVPPSVLADSGVPEDSLPSEGFLRFLRDLSRTHGTPIMYYQSFMWGGDTDTEFAFVYAGDNEILYSFAESESQDSRMDVRANSTIPKRESGDVLVHALRHIELELPSFYFAPHTRSFDWPAHRVRTGA